MANSAAAPNARGGAGTTLKSAYLSRPLLDRPIHSLTYVGLWLFTLFLIFRPAGLAPGLAVLGRLSYVIAALTLLSWIVIQFWEEKRLTARTREVDFVVGLVVVALLTMPYATSPAQAFTTFNDVFIKAVLMFLVMINVVRSDKRLMGLLWLAMAAASYVSWAAVNAYRRGEFAIEGYRVKGMLGGALSDPNDMALFLVTMIPLAVVLMMVSRRRWVQVAYGVLALVMLAGVIVTYSRGGFLALACATLFLGWKMFHRAPVQTTGFAAAAVVACILLLPPNYASRLASIVDPDLDSRGSSSSRQVLLERSVEIAAKNPLTGVGMGNFTYYSVRGQATHNTYTQLAADMGILATVLYLGFIGSCLVRLSGVERETHGASFAHPEYQKIHFLALGLQASILGFLVGSFFLSVAYYWFIYYLVGYGVCLSRVYETGPGRIVGKYNYLESQANS